MGEWKIYYNPRCGSCRKALEYLQSKNIEPTVIEYLKTPPTTAELDDIFKKMGIDPAAAVRTKEPRFIELNLAERRLTREEWLTTISENPVLLQRPIVVHGNRAIIARHSDKIKVLAG